MKKKVLLIVLCGACLLGITGCSNKEKTNSNTKGYLDYNLITEFDDGIAIASKQVNFKPVNYVIDENFNVLFSYEGNDKFIGEYMKVEEHKKVNIVNKNGKIVYSYDDDSSKESELVKNGLLIITEQDNSYNSSTTKTGIYDLENKKYILEPSEKYANKIRTYGDNMLTLNDDNTEFFNTKTKKIVKFSNRVGRDFVDGYSLDTEYSDSTYIVVFDDSGNSKKIKALSDSPEIKEQSNGMLFDFEMRVENENLNEDITGTNVELFDLQKGTVIDLSKEFNLVEKAKFNEDGNALVRFENQGGETYYTIIDKDGNMLFTPQKRNNEAKFGAKSNGESLMIPDGILYNGGYFFGQENDLYKVIDKNNKVIFTSKNKHETFKSITNNSVLVELDEPGRSKVSYYRDLKGKLIKIKIKNKIKKLYEEK